jgi:hypothetical protein
LKRARIDFEEHVIFVDERAFAVILLYEIAGDLGLDVGVNGAIQGGDPIAVDRDVLLLNRNHNDIERARGGGRLGITGTTGQNQHGGQEKRRKNVQT